MVKVKNMQQKSSKGTFIAVIIIILITIGLYFYYKGEPVDYSSSLEVSGTEESTEAQIASGRVLSLLNQISSLEINDSIFKSAVYNSLVDYTIEVPSQPVGRVNPFAPISGSFSQSSISLPSTSR